MTQRKLIIARHGIAEQGEVGSLDILVPETIPVLYENGSSISDFIRANDIGFDKVMLRHSNKKRTLRTGKAIVAGAYEIEPVPQSEEDLDKIDFDGMDIDIAAKLGYSDLLINEKAYGEDKHKPYMENWFRDPDSTDYKGVEVTPFNEYVESRGRYLTEILNTLANGDKDLAVIATHGGNIDAAVIDAVNSGRDTPVTDFSEVGGIFDMEDNAIITMDIDYDGHTRLYQAKTVLERDGQKYDMDLEKMSAKYAA